MASLGVSWVSSAAPIFLGAPWGGAALFSQICCLLMSLTGESPSWWTCGTFPHAVLAGQRAQPACALRVCACACACAHVRVCVCACVCACACVEGQVPGCLVREGLASQERLLGRRTFLETQVSSMVLPTCMSYPSDPVTLVAGRPAFEPCSPRDACLLSMGTWDFWQTPGLSCCNSVPSSRRVRAMVAQTVCASSP